MEDNDLHLNPFEQVHLQWFADGDPAPDPGPDPGPDPVADPKPADVAPPAKPPVKPPKMDDAPKPPGKQKYDGTFLAQAPDKYKKDPKYVDDLLKHKGWGDILDRMYAAEEKAPVKPPESPDEYEFAVAEFPEHLQGDNNKQYREEITAYFGEVTKAIRALAHKNGWSKESAAETQALFVAQVFEQAKAAMDASEKAKKDGTEVLTKDWKGDFGPNMEVAGRAVRTFFDPEFIAMAEENGISNDPRWIKGFYNISKAIGEDTLVPGSSTTVDVSPEAQKRAKLKDRYKNSPEMFEERDTAMVPTIPENLKGRYPSMEKV